MRLINKMVRKRKKCSWEVEGVGYSVTELKMAGAGFVKEKEVFGFQISPDKDPAGNPSYTLSVKVCK